MAKSAALEIEKLEELKKQKALEQENVQAKSTLKRTQRKPDTTQSIAGKTVLTPSQIPFYEELNATHPTSKPKPLFFQKPSTFSDLFLGNLARIISNKKFAIKRTIGSLENPNNVFIKWDRNFVHLEGANARNLMGYFAYHVILNLETGGVEKILRTEEEIEQFVKNYSYMVGVLAVFAEFDYNPDNIGISKKTKRPIKIDNSFCVFYSCEEEEVPISGSSFSHDFLRLFLAQRNHTQTMHKTNDDIEIFLAKSDFYKTKKDPKEYADIFSNSYTKEINYELFLRIRENAAKDDFLKECFMKFMLGIERAIVLAGDDVFLEQYKAQYAEIPIPEGRKNADELLLVFKENAQKARRQFAFFLEYYEQLKPDYDERKAKYKISPEERLELLQEEQAKIEEHLKKNQQNIEFVLGLERELQTLAEKIRLFQEKREATVAEEESRSRIFSGFSEDFDDDCEGGSQSVFTQQHASQASPKQLKEIKKLQSDLKYDLKYYYKQRNASSQSATSASASAPRKFDSQKIARRLSSSDLGNMITDLQTRQQQISQASNRLDSGNLRATYAEENLEKAMAIVSQEIAKTMPSSLAKPNQQNQLKDQDTSHAFA